MPFLLIEDLTCLDDRMERHDKVRPRLGIAPLVSSFLCGPAIRPFLNLEFRIGRGRKVSIQGVVTV